MTTLLYVLAVFTPLIIAGAALAMIWVRWIEHRAEDRVRAEHGLPPRAPRPARPLEADVDRPAPVQALRRRVVVALEPEPAPTPVRTSALDAEPPGRRARGREASTAAGRALPWPLDDLGTVVPTSDEEIRVRRATATPMPAAPATPVPAATPAPAADADGARAALARAAATLAELERAADQADRHGTKDCPSCDRSVRLSARVCPHCRHRMAPEPERRDATAA